MKVTDLLISLADAQIQFVIVGGFAMTMHGFQRATYDVDVALAMTDENLGMFVDLASELGLTPVVPVPLASLKNAKQLDTWNQEKGMIAFALRGPDDLVLDVLIRPVVDFVTLSANAAERSVSGRKFKYAGLDDLLVMKHAAARPKDQIDIIALHKLKRGENPNE